MLYINTYEKRLLIYEKKSKIYALKIYENNNYL